MLKVRLEVTAGRVGDALAVVEAVRGVECERGIVAPHVARFYDIEPGKSLTLFAVDVESMPPAQPGQRLHDELIGAPATVPPLLDPNAPPDAELTAAARALDAADAQLKANVEQRDLEPGDFEPGTLTEAGRVDAQLQEGADHAGN